jgi:predicted ArsR family transcriptional regulator
VATGIDWTIVGPVVGTAGTIVLALIKRDSDREKRIDTLYDKLITDVVPALERATSSAQGFPPILERNTSAMASVVEEALKLHDAQTELLRWVAVLSDREVRPSARLPPPRRRQPPT